MSSHVPGLLLYHLVEVVIIFFNLALRLIQLPLDHNSTTIYQITLRKVKRISGTRLSPVLRLQRRPRVILRSPPPPPYSELNTFWTEEDSPLLHNGRGSRSPTTPTTATRGTSTGCRRRRRCRSGPLVSSSLSQVHQEASSSWRRTCRPTCGLRHPVSQVALQLFLPRLPTSSTGCLTGMAADTL